MLLEDLQVVLKVAEFRSITAAAAHQDIVDGELRIAVSSDLGRNLVTPWLDEFMES